MDYQLQMNYLHPVDRTLSKQELQYLKEDVETVITQQLVISQLSSGITYEDTNNMDEYERVYIFKKLIEMKKDENEAKLKALRESKRK